MEKHKLNKLGFTIVELMVVISIIGLFSSMILGSIATARGKAQDARRIQSLLEVQKAMELYALSNNGEYPSTNSPGNLAGEIRYACYSNSLSMNPGLFAIETAYADISNQMCSGDASNVSNQLSPYIKDLNLFAQEADSSSLPFIDKAYAAGGLHNLAIGVSADRKSYKIMQTGLRSYGNIPNQLKDNDRNADDYGVASVGSSLAAKDWYLPAEFNIVDPHDPGDYGETPPEEPGDGSGE